MSIFDYLMQTSALHIPEINRLDKRAQEIERRISDEKAHARTVEQEVGELRADIARLLLILETIGRLAIDKGLWTREEFEQTVEAIDLEDGVADGQVTPAPPQPTTQRCECGHELPLGAQRCIYCGASLS